LRRDIKSRSKKSLRRTKIFRKREEPFGRNQKRPFPGKRGTPSYCTNRGPGELSLVGI